jgi:hypothetical protein
MCLLRGTSWSVNIIEINISFHTVRELRGIDLQTICVHNTLFCDVVSVIPPS